MKNTETGLYSCDFCGRHQNDAEQIITGEKACICNRCVCVCNEVILGVLKSQSLVTKVTDFSGSGKCKA